MNFYRLKSIFFIIFSCFILQTAAFAQNNVKITIKKKNITLQEALREVEKQSDYLIAFNESKLEKTKRVNLNINAESLDKTLASILSGTGLSYKIKDKYIMIIPQSKVEVESKKLSGIQTHNFPDPDAIASAFGLQELLKLRGIHATICYKGKIDRYSTDKLREILDIRLVNIENIGSELTEDDEVILVDAQKGNSNIIDMTGDEIICIDHHPIYEKTEYRFTDIRPGVGACASIIAQYFFENEIPMDQRIATALTFGIRMDTQKLSRGVCKMDMEMIWRMFDLCDQDMIYLLENSTLYFEDLMAYSKAISSIEVFENISFADTGRDCPEALIASVSDFMLALVEVSFSVVYSRKKEGIKISVRSERPTLDAGKIISKALKGIGSGGGHATMAGGFVPFDGNDREEDLMIQNIRERFIDVISRTKRKSLR